MSQGASPDEIAKGTAMSNGIHQPHPRRPVYSRSLHVVNQDLKAEGEHAKIAALNVPSNRSTPVPPDDAPPSVKATSAARREIRRKTKNRMFPTIEYEDRVSYFDPRSDYTNFRGFFVLFWIGLAIMVITTVLRNLKETGKFFTFRQWPLFTQNIIELAVSDVIMCSSTVVSLPLHLVFKESKAWLMWRQGGMIIQSLFQAAWLLFWIVCPFVRDWTWTAQVYLTLHTLCMLMKMHSYAFYNGHLSNTLNRLKELDLPIGPQTPTTAAVRYPPANIRFFEIQQEMKGDESNHQNISPIVQLREDLAKELTSPVGNVTYPQNLTVYNFADYLLCPTLCYELEYPRTASRSYMELFYKTLAVFGCIFLMTVTSEEFIIPVLAESQIRLQRTQVWPDGALIFAETVSRLLFPFMLTFLLIFLVIFEYVLGAFAEITRFSDRLFFTDFWNNTGGWLEFSREWNIPVSNFLRRHVYMPSRGVKLSRPVSTVITFLISALAHELIMGCITRKFRGYGFIMMMLQMPLVVIQRMPWIRDQQLLNNVLFWISMILGLSLVSSNSALLGRELGADSGFCSYVHYMCLSNFLVVDFIDFNLIRSTDTPFAAMQSPVSNVIYCD